MYSTEESKRLFEASQRFIPGGVNSPVRAFKSVGGSPIFMQKAKGAYLYDVDNNSYIDYINSWGPMILGHGHEDVLAAIHEASAAALSFGAPTSRELRMAELVTSMCPNVDSIRLVSSGTEACMTSIRLARGYTGRDKIIKFEGCYHGHADSFLIKAGSGVATFDIETVPGVTQGVADDTLILPYNDLEKATQLFKAHGSEIACLIIEPVAGNMGCIIPEAGFLQGLRKLCTEYGVIYIFDEVMTGFRLAKGGVQERLSIDADLVTYGKVIGGGMPIGAFGGRQEIMDHIAPVGKVYQAGTLSGNPVAVSAGMATLNILNRDSALYEKIDATTTQIVAGLKALTEKYSIPSTINTLGSMMSIHFGDHPVVDFESAAKCDQTRFNKFFHHMLSNGVYLPPSMYETWFISAAIGDKEIDKTLSVTENFFKGL